MTIRRGLKCQLTHTPLRGVSWDWKYSLTNSLTQQSGGLGGRGGGRGRTIPTKAENTAQQDNVLLHTTTHRGYVKLVCTCVLVEPIQKLYKIKSTHTCFAYRYGTRLSLNLPFAHHISVAVCWERGKLAPEAEAAVSDLVWELLAENNYCAISTTSCVKVTPLSIYITYM